MANSKRRCPNCKEYNRIDDDDTMFNYSLNRLFCNIGCYSDYAVNNRKSLAKKTQKKNRKQTLEERQKSVKYWYEKVQTECNKYIRLKDHYLPCISCGSVESVQWDAGHYKSVGAHPELRYNTHNINKQCVRCNRDGSANYKGGIGWGDGYDAGVVRRFGQERLDWLHGHHPQKNYTAQELQRLLRWFKYRVKQFENKK